MAKLETTKSTGNTTAQRKVKEDKTAVEIAVEVTAVMTAAMAMRAAGSAGRDKKGIGGGGKEGVLT
jgi:hypothetical protein